MTAGKAEGKSYAGRPLPRCVLIGLALVGVLSPLAALGEPVATGYVAVSSAGLIDSRVAAVAEDAAIVVETRARHTMATAESVIDTAREIGTLMMFR